MSGHLDFAHPLSSTDSWTLSFQMSGKGHGLIRHQGRRKDGQLPSFFEGRPSSFGWRCRGEPHAANPALTHPLDEGVNFDEDLIHEIENYTKGAKGDAQVQPLDPPQFAFLPRVLSSLGAGISTSNAGPLTNRAVSLDVGPCYVCED